MYQSTGTYWENNAAQIIVFKQSISIHGLGGVKSAAQGHWLSPQLVWSIWSSVDIRLLLLFSGTNKGLLCVSGVTELSFVCRGLQRLQTGATSLDASHPLGPADAGRRHGDGAQALKVKVRPLLILGSEAESLERGLGRGLRHGGCGIGDAAVQDI